MNKKKIIIITASSSTVKAFYKELIEELVRNMYEVILVCSYDKQLDLNEISNIKYLPVEIPRSIKPIKLIIAFIKIYKIILSENPTIIHTHTPIASFIGQIVALITKEERRIITIHGLYYYNISNIIIKNIFKYLEIITCKIANNIICVNKEDIDVLVKNKIKRSKILLCNVGVSLDKFLFAKEKRDIYRTKLGLDKNKLVIGNIGRIVIEKGIIDLLEALHKIDDDFIFIHIGDLDKEKRGYKKLINRLDELKNDKMHFYGFQTDVEMYLSCMDIFCFPSHREGFPVSVMEAAVLGLPIISTDIRGCREAIVDGFSGILIKPYNSEEITKALKILIKNKSIREYYSRNAQEYAIKYFDRNIMIKTYMELYNSYYCN